MVFGWELDEHQRKPNPYPIIEIIKRFNLDNTEVLVLDDSKPGLGKKLQCGICGSRLVSCDSRNRELYEKQLGLLFLNSK
jgi:phosphoglycolate phosphatase-like HAD superfamily hydrolase